MEVKDYTSSDEGEWWVIWAVIDQEDQIDTNFFIDAVFYAWMIKSILFVVSNQIFIFLIVLIFYYIHVIVGLISEIFFVYSLECLLK